MKRRLRVAAGCAALLIAAAAAAETNDLRNLRVGMAASALPAEGFAAFRCAGAPERTLAGWQEWKSCPVDAQGRHELRFAYDGNETLVAGHPVVLSALIDSDGRITTLRIETDPHARLFLRKKAHLLGLQARSRYGDDGWACTDGQPGADGEPVGRVFVEQSCRKTLPGRSVVVERTLLRRPGTDDKAFVAETRIAITAAP